MPHPHGHGFGLNPLAAALLAALAVPAAPVFAEEPVELEAVTVSATRAGSAAGETPQ